MNNLSVKLEETDVTFESMEGTASQAKKPRSSDLIERVKQSIRKFATLSELVRLFGAAIMLASMSVFLLQGWSDGNDIQRYLKLLLQTGLLAGGGFLTSYVLKENKGARLFFLLALVAVPANFAILGALVYSSVPLGGIATVYPDFARWTVMDAGVIGLVGLGAMALLIPIVFLGFRLLTRQHARHFSALFLGLNALVLLPLRDSVSVSVMLVATLAVPVWQAGKLTKSDPGLKAFQGKLATGLLFIPAGLIAVRSLYLYQLDTLIGLVLSLAAYYVLRQVIRGCSADSVSGKVSELLLTVSAFAAAQFTTMLILENMLGNIASPVCSVLLGAFLFDYQFRVGRTSMKPFVRLMTVVTIGIMMVTYMLVIDSVLAILACGVAGMGLVAMGFHANSRTTLGTGSLVVIGSVLYGFQDLFAWIVSSSWIGLALVGAVAIVVASLLERYGATLKLRYIDWNTRRRNSECDSSNRATQ